MSTSRGPQTIDDEKEQENRRKEKEKYNNAFATAWGLMTNFPLLYCVETGEIVGRENTTSDNSPTLSSPHRSAHELPDGSYRTAQYADLEVKVKDGKASVVGLVKEADIERATELLLTTMAYGKGHSSLILDWENSNGLTKKKLDLALNAFEGRGNRLAVTPIFGPTVEKWLEGLKPEERDHFHKRRREIEQKQLRQEPLYAISKSESFKEAAKEFDSHSKLDLTKSTAGKDHIKDALTKVNPQTKEKVDLKGLEKAEKIITEATAVQDRATSIAQYMQQLEGKVSAEEKTIADISSGTNKDVNIGGVQKIHQHCDPHLKQLTNALHKEIPDVKTKALAWIEEIKVFKTELTQLLANEQQKLQSIKAAHGDESQVASNIEKMKKQLEQIDKIEQNHDASIQKLDKAKADLPDLEKRNKALPEQIIKAQKLVTEQAMEQQSTTKHKR